MKKLSYLILAAALTFSACSKNDPALPDNTLNFSATSQGIESTASSATVTLSLSRAAEAATTINLELVGSNLTYGTQYTTEPAATNGTLTLTIPAGSSSTSFKVNKTAGIFLNGDEYITATVKSANSAVVLGADKSLKLSFSSITSPGAELTLNGGDGGSSAVNSVYVDLSGNAQTSVLRSSWDLGFQAGADYRVIINNVNAAAVIAVNKTDINAVTAADVTLANLEIGFGKGTFSIIDDVNGDLTKTAIAAVSATESENKVYVLARAGGSGVTPAAADLYKIRILRATNGYTLQYAKLTEATFKTLTITKNSAYNFNYISFDTNNTAAAVNVEPVKDRWDFMWSYSIYFTGPTPYAFSDLVFTNYVNSVQTAEVVGNYDTFTEANLNNVTLVTARNTIGANWRNTTGTVGVKTDRFYVIKDNAGNVYKLKFVSFTTQDGGTRGKPVIKYALVKKGA